MQPVTKQTLKIFWEHAWRYKGAVVLIAFTVVFTSSVDVGMPFLYKNLFNVLSAGIKNNAHDAIRTIWLIFALAAVNQVAWRTLAYANNFFQPRVMSDLLNTCYEYLLGHSYNFFNNNFVGSIVTRVRRFQGSFERLADVLTWDISRTLLRVSFILVILLAFKPVLGLLVIIWCAIYVLFAYAYSRFKLKYDIQMAEQETKTTAHLADTITNSLNTKLFTSQAVELKSFKSITEKLYRLRKYAWDLANHAEIFQGFAMVVLEFALLYKAVGYWQRGQLTIGDFALLQAYLGTIFESLWNFGKNIRSIYEALADANEMTEMLMQPQEVVDKKHAAKLKVHAGAIEFRNLNFHYHHGTQILKDFNLRIEAGERVALIGPSGGGKSTIVKLLFRFLDIQGGEILIDGTNIADVTQDSLRRNISLVPQEPILFHRTLMENIRYGKPTATEAEIKLAARAAHAHEFISKFPDGYETYVGERGVKLSGGERQRVAIARAILKNAPILVLDEATSSLDSESESLIQDALEHLMKGKTTIVIAHRLSTIMKMDRIVVIENGKITEQGKHEELLRASQGTYQRLWEIQAGGFALAK